MAIQQIKHRSSGLMLPAPAQKHPFVRFLQSLGSHLSNFLLKYWALCLTFVLGLIVFTALSIPFLSYFGLDAIAKPLFFSLHWICAQVPSHSFYIFGHQIGLCGRNLSIYSSMFVGSLIFVLSKKRLPGIPWWLWVLMCLPMAVDGVTQLLGLRESTAELRILTGTLFGLGNILFVLPLVQKTLVEPPVYTYQPMGPMPHYTGTEATHQNTPNPASTPTEDDAL
jgi:uncharacterized membrane protein